MRVIAGSRRSLPLKTLPGNETRPTTDRIKETLFNMLMPYIPGARFLDLFAGSGGIGIEALSRGASFACFVDNNPKAVAVIKDNVNFTKFGQEAKIFKYDSVKMISAPNKYDAYDIVFIDPPYAAGVEKAVMEAFSLNNGWTNDDTLYIIEASLSNDFSWLSEMGYEIIKEKKYKSNQHIFIRKRI